MAEFIFTPTTVRDPKNHPRRIYFSCHCDDMVHFDSIAAQIRAIEADCVIAYADPDGDEALRLGELEDFHLTVVPVTENWFQQGSHSREFARLTAAHKAILPILFSNSLEKRFNQTTDNLQFLRINDPDFTEKLQRTLQDILFDSKLLGKVRTVFTHKMFVSYCREDVEQARRLIRCIHSVESGKRIAIWYDKYLPMGKNFEDSIFAELDDSQFFAVTLTPSLLGRDNYVKTYEYPRAQTGDKQIIFFELTPVDRTELLAQLERAEEYDCISLENPQAFAAFVRRLIGENPGRTTLLSSAETDYLLALAYQNGLFVEFDHSYAAKKFKSAANARHPDAAHALANMFYRGLGISRDVEKAISWYKKEVRIVEQDFQKAVEQLRRLKKEPIAVRNSKTGQISGPNEEAFDAMQKAIDQVCSLTHDLMVCCCNNARILRDEGRINGAEQLYRIALRSLDLIDSIANVLALGEKYRSSVENELNVMLIVAKNPDADVCKATWLSCLQKYTADPKVYLNIHGLLHSAHNYGAMLLKQRRCEEARRVMLQALEAAEDATDDRALCELELVLHRDVGRSYILNESVSGEQRAANAKAALGMFESVRWLLEDAPFDLEENPYLYTLKPWSLFYTGDAYDYAGDHSNAYVSYLQALAQMCEAEKVLGDRAEAADFPLALLEFYARCLQKLARYGVTDQSPMLCAFIDQLLRHYGDREFAAEFAPIARNYLKNLGAALEVLNETED